MHTPHLPVIALTTLAGEEDIAKGREVGISDYQIKLDRGKINPQYLWILDRKVGDSPMEKPSGNKMASRAVEMATFYVGQALCGMDILNVQEFNKLMDMTTVPQAPDYVMGILNLRGQIVTIIDLGKKLDLGSTELSEMSRNIIVNCKGRAYWPAGQPHQ